MGPISSRKQNRKAMRPEPTSASITFPSFHHLQGIHSQSNLYFAQEIQNRIDSISTFNPTQTSNPSTGNCRQSVLMSDDLLSGKICYQTRQRHGKRRREIRHTCKLDRSGLLGYETAGQCSLSVAAEQSPLLLLPLNHYC